MKDYSTVAQWIIHTQMDGMRYKFAVLKDTQISHIISRQPCFGIERGGKGVGAKADIVRRPTRIDNRTLAVRQSLIKCKPGQAITETHNWCGQVSTRRAVWVKTMPLRECTS